MYYRSTNSNSNKKNFVQTRGLIAKFSAAQFQLHRCTNCGKITSICSKLRKHMLTKHTQPALFELIARKKKSICNEHGIHIVTKHNSLHLATCRKITRSLVNWVHIYWPNTTCHVALIVKNSLYLLWTQYTHSNQTHT